MSPLLFLAVAVVVPLVGMVVSGVSARIRRQKLTDDDTEQFRRRLKSLAPPALRAEMRPELKSEVNADMTTRQHDEPKRDLPTSVRLVERVAESEIFKPPARDQRRRPGS